MKTCLVTPLMAQKQLGFSNLRKYVNMFLKCVDARGLPTGCPRTFPHPLESSCGGRSPPLEELRVQAVSGARVAPERPQPAAYWNSVAEQDGGGDLVRFIAMI